MNITTRSLGPILAIDIAGKLDTTTSTMALEQLLLHLDASPDKVLVCLEPLEFVSSAGLRVVLRVAKQMRGYGGVLKVSGARGMVKEVLEISGFDSLLDLHEEEDQALSSF